MMSQTRKGDLAMIIYKEALTIENLLKIASSQINVTVSRQDLESTKNSRGTVKMPSSTALQTKGFTYPDRSQQTTNSPTLANLAPELVVLILDKMLGDSKRISSVCLGLSCRRLLYICKPYWYLQDPGMIRDFWGLSNWVHVLGCQQVQELFQHRCISIVGNLPVQCSYTRLSDLLKDWMGPQYEFKYLRNGKGGCFVNVDIYGTSGNLSHLNTERRQALKESWADYSFSTYTNFESQGHLRYVLPRPFNAGPGWWRLAHAAMFADISRHDTFKSWKKFWGSSHCYQNGRSMVGFREEVDALFAILQDRAYEIFSDVLGWF